MFGLAAKRWFVPLCLISFVLLVSLPIVWVLIRVSTVHKGTIASSDGSTAYLESTVVYSDFGFVRITSLDVQGDNLQESISHIHSEPIRSISSFAWHPIQENRFGFHMLDDQQFLLTFPLSPDLNGVIHSLESNAITLINVDSGEDFENVLKRYN